MKIGVIGLGDLGVANVALFASFGNEVVAYDSNTFRVSLLNKGIKLFKDERIKEIIVNNKNQIIFTSNMLDLSGVEIILISVELDNKNGEYSLDSFYRLIDRIKNEVTWKTTLLIKTPLPIGTSRTVDKYLNSNKDNFLIAYMPYVNFDNSLYENIFTPEQIVVGTISQNAHLNVRLLYENFLLDGRKMFFMSYEEAEMYRISQSVLNIMCHKYFTNMHNLYNDYNLNINSLLSTLEYPKINENFVLGNSNEILRESNNIKFFLKNNFGINKTLEEGNINLAEQIVDKIPKNVEIIGILGISDLFDEISKLSLEVIKTLLKRFDKQIIVYDNSNEENLKKIIGANKKLKYAIDEKGLVKKADVVVILSKSENITHINESFYLKYGHDDLVVYDFVGVYKYSQWKNIKLIKAYENKKHIYKEIHDKEKAPQ